MVGVTRPQRRLPDPKGAPLPPPGAADGPATREPPARQVQPGAFDDSVAGEEDPGAGVDTLTPRPGR